MSLDFLPLSWPISRLAEALETLARRSGFPVNSGKPLPSPTSLALKDDDALGRWMESAASCLGVEAEPLEMSYGEVEQLVCTAAPALLQLPGSSEPHFLLLLDDQKAVTILGPDLAVHHLQPAAVSTALRQGRHAPLVTQVDQLLSEAGVPTRRLDRVRETIL